MRRFNKLDKSPTRLSITMDICGKARCGAAANAFERSRRTLGLKEVRHGRYQHYPFTYLTLFSSDIQHLANHVVNTLYLVKGEQREDDLN